MSPETYKQYRDAVVEAIKKKYESLSFIEKTAFWVSIQPDPEKALRELMAELTKEKAP